MRRRGRGGGRRWRWPNLQRRRPAARDNQSREMSRIPRSLRRPGLERPMTRLMDGGSQRTGSSGSEGGEGWWRGGGEDGDDEAKRGELEEVRDEITKNGG